MFRSIVALSRKQCRGPRKIPVFHLVFACSFSCLRAKKKEEKGSADAIAVCRSRIFSLRTASPVSQSPRGQSSGTLWPIFTCSFLCLRAQKLLKKESAPWRESLLDAMAVTQIMCAGAEVSLSGQPSPVSQARVKVQVRCANFCMYM